LNNYRKKPFVPTIQKTSTLVTLSLLSLICFIVSLNFKTIEVSSSHNFKIEAANLMEKSLKTLKDHRLENSVFIDAENDPNETGLIGVPYSLITTDEGDLDAKLTTLDPNFSAVMVDLMHNIKLKKNDTVAVMLTGSMPGANIAVLSACKAMGVYPILISSLGASQWGANQIDFTWLDMESILYENDLIPSRSIAASIGGRNDMGRLLSPAGRKILTDNIAKHRVSQINKKKLADNIKERLQIYSSQISLKRYNAVINIGGGVASLGTSFNQRLLPPGIVKRSNIIEIGKNDGIEGAFSKLIKLNITGLHILNIKSLIENYDLPFAPIPNPKIGTGRLYLEERYNLPIVLLCLIIISGAVFYVGYQSKKQIKEHLTKYEPDSLL
tara:strand:+ start:65 stop:1216 length:1152 start_codon:yes stop_codon:yes gene_type:complete